jgi:hypothetical protein
MEKITIELEIKNDIKKIGSTVDKLNESFEATNDEVQKISKSTKNAEGGIKSLAGGFKGMGLAIKALGIGLLMEAFNMFKDILSKNQVVVDIFNTAMEALTIVFNDLIKLIFSNFPKVIEFFKDVFENPTEYLKKFGDAIMDNLIERFNSFLDTLGYLTDALKNLFTGNFSGALDSLKKAGKESVDVLTGVNNSVDKAGDLAEKAANAVGKYVTQTIEQAKALVKLKNDSQIAAAEQAALVEKFDREAEKLRQKRDDDLLSIEDRKKANDDLNEVLKNQTVAMQAVANAQIAAAKAEKDKNNSIENRVALINAEANKAGVLAQIEGLISEQKANAIALTKEGLDLQKAEKEGIADIQIAEKQAATEFIKNERQKLDAQLANLKEEKDIQLNRLKSNIELYKLGTQARVDAEKEYNAKKQELEASIASKEDEIRTYKFNKDQELRQEVFNNELESYSMRLFALQKFNEEAQKSTQLSEEEKIKIQKDTVRQEKVLQSQRLAMIANTLGNISSLFNAASTEGKAFAVAQALINTYQGITAELATKTATPYEYGIKLVNVATTAAMGFKAVRDIISTQPSASGGGGGGESPAGMSVAAPQFNVVGTSGINQIAQTINTREAQPVKAYVVASEVTSQQSLDRNKVSSASLG